MEGSLMGRTMPDSGGGAVTWRKWARMALWATAFGLGLLVWFLPYPAGLVFYLALVLCWLLMLGGGSVDEEDEED